MAPYLLQTRWFDPINPMYDTTVPPLIIMNYRFGDRAGKDTGNVLVSLLWCHSQRSLPIVNMDSPDWESESTYTACPSAAVTFKSQLVVSLGRHNCTGLRK